MDHIDLQHAKENELSEAEHLAAFDEVDNHDVFNTDAFVFSQDRITRWMETESLQVPLSVACSR